MKFVLETTSGMIQKFISFNFKCECSMEIELISDFQFQGVNCSITIQCGESH